MAGIVPHYRQKLELLAKREQVLLHLLKAGRTSDKKLIEAAELVRSTRIAALKARMGQIPPSEKNLLQFEAYESEVAQGPALPIEQLITAYRLKPRERGRLLPRHSVQDRLRSDFSK